MWLLHNLGQRSDEILRENYVSVRAMDRLNEAVERIDSSFQFALAGREKEAAELYREHWAEYRTQVKVEEANVTIVPDEPRLVTRTRPPSRATVAWWRYFEWLTPSGAHCAAHFFLPVFESRRVTCTPLSLMPPN